MQTALASISRRYFHHTCALRLSRYYATATPRLLSGHSVNAGTRTSDAADFHPKDSLQGLSKLRAPDRGLSAVSPSGADSSEPEVSGIDSTEHKAAVNSDHHSHGKSSGIQPEEVMGFLRTRVRKWCRASHITRRLHGFGVQQFELEGLLRAWEKAVFNGSSLVDKSYPPAQLSRLAYDLSSPYPDQYIDRALTAAFLHWVDKSSRASKPTLFHVRQIREALDLTRLPDMFPVARAMRRRVIMHVGPTNSGKTHNALRALAAAKVGAYAGPLRLLAHEIYERLNSGQIIPLGIDPEKLPDAPPPDEDTNLDAISKDGAIRKLGDPRFQRLCNLMTGEERKITNGAGLTSCTIEMLEMSTLYDVLVVDEIQMLSDSDRGFSWTAAVLGAAARELHLCGEEAAVPLVRSLLECTGDELIVNHYERLSPLQVAEESLHGDLKNIRKGDCVVAFSRKNIFALKERIERVTGLRCALIYGRLPPEIRSEQAALFNDPDSGYDVLIGSDAIGMGLNLKIRRIIFDALSKFNGNEQRPLAYSQVKQIAGRAGRFGLHDNKRETGVVTTLNAADLESLREAMEAPAESIRYARVGWFQNLFDTVMEALPRNASATNALDALSYASTCPPNLAVMDADSVQWLITEMLDSIVRDMPLTERDIALQTPVPYRDILCRKAAAHMLAEFRDKNRVDLRRVLEKEGLLQILEKVLTHKEAGSPMVAFSTPLHGLETLHRVLIVYVWLHMHRPIAFYAYNQAIALKQATEEAMEWLLSTRAKAQEQARAKSSKDKLLPSQRHRNQGTDSSDKVASPGNQTAERIL